MSDQPPIRFNRIQLYRKPVQRVGSGAEVSRPVSSEELRLKQCEAEVMAAVRRLIRDLKERTA